MITVIVSDINQISILEDLLRKAKVDFGVTLRRENLALATPYMEVDGVPLDLTASITYITELIERNAHE